MSGKTLKRTFGMKEAVTITVGTVVGVGMVCTQEIKIFPKQKKRG